MENNKKIILILVAIFFVFAGCNTQDKETLIKTYYNISIGNIEEIVDYNPETFSTTESCVLVVNNKSMIIKDRICSNIMQGDELFKHYKYDSYAHKRGENYFN